MKFRVETVNGTATGGLDYVRTVADLTIEPGATSASVVVPLLEDSLDEPDETFFVKVITIAGANLVPESTGRATIFDNDPSPS